MPLTDDGFIMPEYEDVLADKKIQIKKVFGTDIDLSDGSPMGMLARIWSEDQMENEQYAQEIYDSNFPNSASGISLDRLSAIAGVQRKQAQYAQAILTIQGQPGYLIEANTEFTTDNGDSFFTDEDTQIGKDGTVQLITHSEDAAGYTNVEKNTIINPMNPVDEIESVTNLEPASGGADLETDLDLRNRLTTNLESLEGPTASGIRTAILNVDGVQGVTVQTNNSKETDSNGNPPNTIHVFVTGGNPDDIATKLADTIAGGATTVGKQQHIVNIYGNDVQVNFDVAINTTIYFKLDLDIDENFDRDSINQSVQDFINDFEMGTKIILNKLYTYLYDLTGIKTVNEILIKKNDTEFSSNNIQLENYEIANTNDDAIEVISHE